jgi:hypothetical protein
MYGVKRMDDWTTSTSTRTDLASMAIGYDQWSMVYARLEGMDIGVLDPHLRSAYVWRL